MAFRSHSSGEWFAFTPDPEDESTTVKLRIKAVPPHKVKAIADTYNVRSDSPPLIVAKSLVDQAAYAWVDAQDFVVIPEGEEEAKAMGRAFPTPVAVDEEVKLDGKLTDHMKRVVFDHFPIMIAIPDPDDKTKTIHVSLPVWIVNKAAEAGQIQAAREESLGKA